MRLKALIGPFTYRRSDARSLWAQADLAHANGDPREARSIYRHLAGRKPQSAEAYLYSGLSEYRLGNPKVAVDILEAGFNKYPDVEYLLEHYLRISCELGQFDRVGSFAARPLDFAETGMLWPMADLLEQHGRSDKAEVIYRQLAQRAPRSARDFLYLALSEYRLRNPQKAVDLLEAGLNDYPEAEYLLEQHLRICSELGQMDRVISLIAPHASKMQTVEALFERFTDSQVKVSLIEYCLKTGFVELAEQMLRHLLARCDDIATLWRLADLLVHHGWLEEADAIYRNLSKRVLTTPDSFLYAALSNYRLKNPENAIGILEAGLSQKFPEAEYLLEHYLNIATEIGHFDRVVRFIEPNAGSQVQACESIFKRFKNSPHLQIGLIGYCLKSGLLEVAERQLKIVQDNYSGDAFTIWRIGDLLTQHGRSDGAGAIYRQLSERQPKSQEDYYFKALASLRLENAEACLDILEEGQTRYPKSKELFTLYIQLCAGRLEYDRYTRFVKESKSATFNPADSLLDFYRAAIINGAPEAFIINLKDLELKCDAETFDCLKGEFLSFLQENPQPIQRAKLMVFFSKYLDVSADFAFKLLEVLQYSCRAADGDVKINEHSLQMFHDLTPPMIPHYAAEPDGVVREFILASQSLSKRSVELTEPITDMTNNWTPWQYIFCLAAPKLYGEAMSAFERVVFKTWPKLDFTASHVRTGTNSPATSQKRIRIGFTVHDSMPMMSGLLSRLDRNIFETIFLRPGKAGQSHTAKNWIARAEKTVEYSDVNTYSAIETIANQELDMIISGPSIAAIFYPMMARLAPLQMVLLEPNWTDGLTNADYYISWQQAEPAHPADFYKTAVSFLRHPPYWIERPLLDGRWPISQEEWTEVRKRLLKLDAETRIYLCANTPPKIHPEMDDIFYDLLERDQAATLVLLRGEYPPAKSLRIRLRDKLGKHYERVIFLPTLRQDDAHLLLQSVDCCLDSYPLCGMSSSFDGAMLGVPIVTLPVEIPFGRWTAAIYEYIGVSGLTARDRQEYVDIALRLARDEQWRRQLAMEIKDKASKYVESQASSDEFQEFIVHAWKRKLAGLPSANWLSGGWH